MNTEPLDDLDEEKLVRMARYTAKGIILSGDQREILFLADFLELIAKRSIASMDQARSNLDSQKN